MIGAKRGGKSSYRTVLRTANAESSYSRPNVQPSSSPGLMELAVSFREEPCYGQPFAHTHHGDLMVLGPGAEKEGTGLSLSGSLHV